MKSIYPTKIVFSEGEVTYGERLIEKKIEQIGLSECKFTEFYGNSSVIVDFGREICGGVRILTYHADNCKKVRLCFGESVSECCSSIGDCNSTNDHSTRDMIVELQSYSDMTFGNTGFRFLKIQTFEDACIRIKSIIAVLSVDQRAFVGSFKCDDAQINDIWNTAAYTMRLCLQNGFIWDGIKRDRLVWMGDIHPELLACECLFGNIAEIKASMEFVKGQTPLSDWMNGIPMYSMWWIIILSDYYLYTGDRAYIEGQCDYIVSILGLINEHILPDGTTRFPYNFIDWKTHYQKGESEEKRLDELKGVASLALIAANKASLITSVIGKGEGIVCEIKNKLSGVDISAVSYKQIAALAHLAGFNSEENKKLLLKNGASGLSTFMSYYILTSIGDYGEYDGALSILKQYYGGMLDLGATTFWEDFDIKWLKNACRIDVMPDEQMVDVHRTYGRFCYTGYRHSLCHGWSSGVIKYLIETVAGIKVADVGCKKIAVNPHLSGLKYVQAEFPTVHGIVKVEVTNTNDDDKVNIDLPNGVEKI